MKIGLNNNYYCMSFYHCVENANMFFLLYSVSMFFVADRYILFDFIVCDTSGWPQNGIRTRPPRAIKSMHVTRVPKIHHSFIIIRLAVYFTQSFSHSCILFVVILCYLYICNFISVGIIREDKMLVNQDKNVWLSGLMSLTQS